MKFGTISDPLCSLSRHPKVAGTEELRGDKEILCILEFRVSSHGLIFIHFVVLHIPVNHMQHFASFPSTTSKQKPLGYRWIHPSWWSPNHRTSLISQESISRIHTCFRYMSLSHHAPCATVAGGVYVGSTYTSICAKYFLRVIPTLARYSCIVSRRRFTSVSQVPGRS